MFPWGEKKQVGELYLNNEILKDILDYAKPLGHNENPANLNLGFGFLYYGLARSLRPKHTLVIGSGYGFSVVCLALGIKHNGAGSLTFVDPSYSLLKNGPFKTVGGSGKWDDPQEAYELFRMFGVEDIVTHYKLRNDEFFPSYESFQLPKIDLGFIDGNHAFKDVKYDFLSTLKYSHKNTYIFLHDSNIYVREIIHHAGVKRWLKI
ncbi:MAG: class I SAM-dependent methyltransferase, partial [Deltaproteobacteria bacterium]|nr:class I SAM-dependent methyltransferase [Deltaproteobacteria bacterium]